jgi:hypothetical protein
MELRLSDANSLLTRLSHVQRRWRKAARTWVNGAKVRLMAQVEESPCEQATKSGDHVCYHLRAK